MVALTERKPDPSDVGDEEWALVAPYLRLLDEGVPQRSYPLREVFNALRWLVRAGASWRMLPHDLPPWPVVYQQTQRWLATRVFDALVQDLRHVLRLAEGRDPEPTAAIRDSRTLHATPERGGQAGDDGAKRRKGSKVHLTVDTLGQFLALQVTPANEQERAQVAALAAAVQEATGEAVELAYVDASYTGERPAEAAAAQGIALEVVTLDAVKRGFVLLPRRWVVERRFGWLARFRRLARDDERLAQSLAGLHLVAFAILMAARLARLLAQGTLTGSRGSGRLRNCGCPCRREARPPLHGRPSPRGNSPRAWRRCAAHGWRRSRS